MIDRSFYTAGVALPGSRTAPSVTARLLGLMSVWRQHRHLENLDARMRRDIGLNESDVVREIHRPVWTGPAHWLR